MGLRMYQVDAFTDRPFGGNPAAVLLLESWPSDALMLSIAAENNLAETAFAIPDGPGRWRLRWFAPLREVAFCGHATLATAHVLVAERGEPAKELEFETGVGILRVRPGPDGYRMSLPVYAPEPTDLMTLGLPDLFGESLVQVVRNFENVFVRLRSEADVRGFVPDLERIGVVDPLGVVITAPGDTVDFVSRYFAPTAGIPEDPVTGSTHATLAPYWARELGKSRLVARQLSRRGGELICEVEPDRVVLTGRAVTVLEAEFRGDLGLS